MHDEVLAVVRASPPRRWLAVAVLMATGALLLYVALAAPPAPLWQLFLIIMGALVLWLGLRLYQATQHAIELTRTELRTSAGEIIVPVAEIKAVDRGTFAFKPSNGFLVHTTNPGGRTWQPGLWWRLGRRIGVGGVTPAAQAKFMSEMLALMLLEDD